MTALAARPRTLPAWLPAAALLGLGWLTIFAGPWADDAVNDLFVYRQYADLFLDGLLPFRDVTFEYPPLGALPLGLPASPGPARTTTAWLRPAHARAGLRRAAALRSARPADGRRPTAAPSSRSRSLPLFAGAMLRTHFDLLPVAIALAALAAIASRRIRLGFVLLGVGAMTKAFPLVVAPVALAWLAGRGEPRAAARGAVALAATLVVIGGAWLALSPEGAWDAVAYHVERPVQVESAPAAVLYAVDALGGESPVHRSSHKSDGLLHPAAGALAVAFSLALLAVLAWLAAAAARRPDTRSLVLASLTAIAAIAALGKVLSPQFLIWTAPLAALAFAWRMHALAGALALATMLTLVEFPSRYFDVVGREPAALALVGIRDAVLIAAVGLAAVALRRESRGASRRGPAAARSLGARPSSPASISTALTHGSPSAVSKLTGIWVTKRRSASSRFTPITPLRGPVIPTSVM